MTRWLALLLLGLGLGLVGAARASATLDGWRIEAARTRLLAENDAPRAYREAQRLQASLPADALAVDRVRAFNLLARAELYLALSDAAQQHAELAMALAQQQGDRVGQAEAQLNVTLNAINQAKIGVSIAATTRAMELLEGMSRPDLLGEALLRMSMMYLRLRDWDNSATLAMQAMELAKRNRDPLARTYAHQGMAASFEQSGNHAQAREHYARMREQARAAHSSLLEAHAIQGLGVAVAGLGDAAGAERLMRESLARFRALQLPFYINHVSYGLADLMRQQGRAAEAVRLLDELIARYEKYPNKMGLWWSLGARGENHHALGNSASAWADAQRAYALAKEIDSSYYASESARHMAALLAAAGEHRRAYRLAAEAAALEQQAARERISTRMVELAQRYETESKQREIDELTRRNEQQTAELQKRTLQQRLLWSGLVGGGLVLVSGVYFVLRLRRSNRMLAALNTQVRRSENQLQATLDAIPDPFFVLGLDGRYHDCRTPRVDLLAAPVADLIGKTIFEVLPPDAVAVCMSALHEAHDSGRSTGQQFELPLAQGTSWFELSVTRKPTESGQAPRFIVLSRDITERKRMERELAASQHLLRQLAARTETAREDERKHLAREIHDELGQYLLALRLGVSVLGLQFGAHHPALQDSAQRLVEMVDATIKVVRDVVASLRPTALNMGIASGLEWLVGGYGGRTNLQFELNVCEDEMLLDDQCATAIFRIVQESLTNIVRHAQASKVEISLKRNEAVYILEVRDNGRGFDPTQRKEKSFGLLSIRERALMLGGEVEVASAPGRETAIRVRIPIHEGAIES